MSHYVRWFGQVFSLTLAILAVCVAVWLMIRALEKASQKEYEALQLAMGLPVDTEEQKDVKIAAVKSIYDSLNVGEDAKKEIVRLHEQAMGYVAELGLSSECAVLLRNYAAALIGRKK